MSRDWEKKELDKELKKLGEGESELLEREPDDKVEEPLELKDLKKEKAPRDWDERDLV